MGSVGGSEAEESCGLRFNGIAPAAEMKTDWRRSVVGSGRRVKGILQSHREERIRKVEVRVLRCF